MRTINLFLVMTGLNLSMASSVWAESRIYSAVSSCVWGSTGVPTQYGIENTSTTAAISVECSTALCNGVEPTLVLAYIWDRSRSSAFRCTLTGTDQWGNDVGWTSNPITQSDVTASNNSSSLLFSIMPGTVQTNAMFFTCSVPPVDSEFGASFFSSFEVEDNGC